MCLDNIDFSLIYLFLSILFLCLFISTFFISKIKKSNHKKLIRIILFLFFIIFFISFNSTQIFGTTCRGDTLSYEVVACSQANPHVSNQFINESWEDACIKKEIIAGVPKKTLENGSTQVCCGIPKE